MPMNTDRDATRRRHIRDKSIIDHLARELFKPPPEPAAEKTEHPKSMTDTGLPVEGQIRKEWDPSKGQYCSLYDSDGGGKIGPGDWLRCAGSQRIVSHLAFDPARPL